MFTEKELQDALQRAEQRRAAVAEGRSTIAAAILAAVRDHALTYKELVGILAVEILGWAKEE